MSKFFYSGEIKQENYLSRRDVFLNLIYGKWFNILIAGLLFTSYGLFTVFYNVTLYNYITIPNILPRLIGAILVIMGILFFSNSLWLQYKQNTINKVLRYRGIFDTVYGLVLIFIPNLIEFFSLSIIGFFLIMLGVRGLFYKKDSSLISKTLSIIFILVGLGNFGLYNPVLGYQANIDIFSYFLGFLGIYLIYLSFNYRKFIKPFEDEEKGFTDYKIE